MTPVPVACSGDVTATAGTLPFTGATIGTWTPGTVAETASVRLKAGGAYVLHTAVCTFTFSGTAPPSTVTVTGASTVTLTAKATVLLAGGQFVLRSGDSATDTYGNTLLAGSSRALLSS